MAKILAMTAAFGLLAFAGCGDGHDHSSHDHSAPAVKTTEPPPAPADASAKPYPLKTCIISGEELGKMGEPVRFTYKGQEIKLCCKACQKKFDADADKLLEKIAAGAGK
jgi:hypothetical protein